jgi:hypothetical protein
MGRGLTEHLKRQSVAALGASVGRERVRASLVLDAQAHAGYEGRPEEEVASHRGHCDGGARAVDAVCGLRRQWQACQCTNLKCRGFSNPT